MVKRRAWWPVGVVCASVVVLSGCVGGGGPVVESLLPVVTEQSVEPSPSPSVSVEERLLAMIPEEAKGDTLMAAEAMAKFFITLHPGLYQGHDPALFEYLSLPDCQFCSSSVASAVDDVTQGRMQVGGDWIFHPGYSDTVLSDDYTTAYVAFSVTQERGTYVDANGEVVDDLPERDFRFTFQLDLSDELWHVAGVAYETL